MSQSEIKGVAALRTAVGVAAQGRVKEARVVILGIPSTVSDKQFQAALVNCRKADELLQRRKHAEAYEPLMRSMDVLRLSNSREIVSVE